MKPESKSNINPHEVIQNIKEWTNSIEAHQLQIKSALITLAAYVEDIEKEAKKE